MVNQLDGANLDEAISVQRIEAGGLGADDDFAQRRGRSAPALTRFEN